MMSNIELPEKLQKPIIRKFEKRKVHSSFTDNICGVDLSDIQLINKLDKGFRFLLYAVDNYSKYARVIPLKDKRGIKITNAFQKILDEFKHKTKNLGTSNLFYLSFKGIKFNN